MDPCYRALDFFAHGYGCAQSVLAAYAPRYGLNEKLALKLATGFGSGMGRMCEMCGALTGAYMVIGLQFGRWQSDGQKYGVETERCYRLVAAAAEMFRQRHGTTQCRELLHKDLSDPLQRQQAKDEGLFTDICVSCVRDAVEIVEQLIAQELESL